MLQRTHASRRLAHARRLTTAAVAVVALMLGAASQRARADHATVPAPAGQTASAQNPGTQPMQGVGIIENLGDNAPMDVTFKDDHDQTVKLGDYFVKGRPVVLSLMYYQCPGMCKAELSAMIDVFAKMKMTPGKEFEVICVSIDPRETPDLAAAKKRTTIDVLGKPEAAEGWAFLTGDPVNVEKLTKAAGFSYRFNEQTGQYAHDSAMIVMTPDGRFSRYLRGFHFEPDTVKLALVEATGGKIGSLSERIQLQLCGYDPRYGKYVLAAQSIMAIGGALTMMFVGGLVGFFWWREHKRRRKANSDSEVQVHPV